MYYCQPQRWSCAADISSEVEALLLYAHAAKQELKQTVFHDVLNKQTH